MDFLEPILSVPSYELLFLLSFLASTLLPLGSEWLLVVMIVQGFSPVGCVVVASIGNYGGACTTYLIGRWGAERVSCRWLRMDEQPIHRAKVRYEKYGSWSLLFSWVPIVGDPLCLVAGIFRAPFVPFSILVFIGKCARYSFLAYLTFCV